MDEVRLARQVWTYSFFTVSRIILIRVLPVERPIQDYGAAAPHVHKKSELCTSPVDDVSRHRRRISLGKGNASRETGSHNRCICWIFVDDRNIDKHQQRQL